MVLQFLLDREYFLATCPETCVLNQCVWKWICKSIKIQLLSAKQDKLPLFSSLRASREINVLQPCEAKGPLAFCWTFHIFWKRRCYHWHGFGITEGSVHLVISATMWAWEVIDELFFLFLGSPDTMLVETTALPPCTCAITMTTGRKSVCSSFFPKVILIESWWHACILAGWLPRGERCQLTAGRPLVPAAQFPRCGGSSCTS